MQGLLKPPFGRGWGAWVVVLFARGRVMDPVGVLYTIRVTSTAALGVAPGCGHQMIGAAAYETKANERGSRLPVSPAVQRTVRNAPSTYMTLGMRPLRAPGLLLPQSGFLHSFLLMASLPSHSPRRAAAA